MRPVVDIISTVVTWMKPTLSVDGVVMNRRGAIEYIETTKFILSKLFVGTKLKVVFTEGTYYTKITAIDSLLNTFTVDLTADNFASSPTSISVVLNYDYGDLEELRTKFKAFIEKSTVKSQQFPAIILVQPFPEKINLKKHEREVTLRLLILTDSKQEYTAQERYTNTLKPILYPLYDLLIKAIDKSTEVRAYDMAWTKTDQIFWGRVQGDKTASNIFADFIDAIEIENLNLQILKDC